MADFFTELTIFIVEQDMFVSLLPQFMVYYLSTNKPHL